MIGADTTRTWLRQEETVAANPAIDWARIPADQHDAVRAALELASLENGGATPQPRPPETTREVLLDYVAANPRGGYVYWTQLVDLLGLLCDHLDGQLGLVVGEPATEDGPTPERAAGGD